MNKILIIEDDSLYGESIAEYLNENGFVAKLARCAQSAINMSFNENFDLYILDLHLQNENGIDLLNDLKLSNKNIKSIFLTSDPSSKIAIKCLEMGCSDYIRKTCDFDEIVARLHKALNTFILQESKTITLKTGHVYNAGSKTLSKNTEYHTLNPKEFELFELLLAKRNMFTTMDDISITLWSSSQEPSFGAIRVYISNLKKILGNESIQNIRGLGYKLVI